MKYLMLFVVLAALTPACGPDSEGLFMSDEEEEILTATSESELSPYGTVVSAHPAARDGDYRLSTSWQRTPCTIQRPNGSRYAARCNVRIARNYRGHGDCFQFANPDGTYLATACTTRYSKATRVREDPPTNGRQIRLKFVLETRGYNSDLAEFMYVDNFVFAYRNGNKIGHDGVFFGVSGTGNLKGHTQDRGFSVALNSRSVDQIAFRIGVEIATVNRYRYYFFSRNGSESGIYDRDRI